MKIGLVSPYDFAYPGGVTQHISHLAAAFRRAGHEVHIIAPCSRISVSLNLSRSVKQLLAAERFDVLHLHEPLMPALPLTVLRHSQALNVGTFHAFRQSNISAYFYGKSVLRYFVGRLHGREHAREVMRTIQYEPAPPYLADEAV